MKISFQEKSIPDQVYHIILTLFFAILGTHFLNYHLYLFAFAALFLIDYKRVKGIDFLLITTFVVSVYIIWFILDRDVLFKFDIALSVLSELALIVLIYLVGRSIDFSKDINIKSIFYLLFIFFIAYTLVIGYSYLAIKQDQPLTWKGLFVVFPNEYNRLGVNGGRFISTIIGYYLTAMSLVFAYFAIYIDKIKKSFKIYEIIILLLLSVFALYLAALMGRRTTIVLFIVAFAVVLFFRIIFDTNKKEKIIIVGLFLLLSLVSYYLFWDTIKEHFGYIYHRLTHQGLKAARFSFWIPGLQAMLDNPVGGGHGVFVGHNMRLAHNTWIDIGKDFGIIPFILFLVFTLLHLYYFVRIIFFPKIENLLKVLLVVVMVAVFPILMIEPVFTSDKTYFAYIIFYFGLVSNLYHTQVKNSLGN